MEPTNTELNALLELKPEQNGIVRGNFSGTAINATGAINATSDTFNCKLAELTMLVTQNYTREKI